MIIHKDAIPPDKTYLAAITPAESISRPGVSSHTHASFLFSSDQHSHPRGYIIITIQELWKASGPGVFRTFFFENLGALVLTHEIT